MSYDAGSCPNESLQRTMLCGLAAEAGSLGGVARTGVVLLVSLVLGICVLGCQSKSGWGTVEFRSMIGRLELAN